MNYQQFEFCRLSAPGTMSSTEAARQAGYKNPAVAACRLMKRKNIQERISLLRQRYIKNKGVEVSKLIDKLITIAQQPGIVTYLTKHPDTGEIVWKDPSELTPEQTAALKGTIPVKNVLDEWSKYELHDRAKAVTALVELLNPQLSDVQSEFITDALCRIGSERGFHEIELAILRESLTKAA